MAEALKTFKEGDDILASETNENNQYLLSRLSDNAAQIQSYVEGEISTMKSNIASVQETLQNNIDSASDSIEATLSSSGLYITTYTSGNSWYREFFSDETKTTRVWLEQGGQVTTPATVGLLKSFSNANYCVQLTSTEPLNGGNYQNLSASARQAGSFYASFSGSHEYRTGCIWFACGK